MTLDRGTPGRLGRIMADVRRSTARAAVRAITPARPVLRNAAQCPLSIAGTGLADLAAFHLGTGWGLLITGASLWLIEHMIADE